MNDTVIHEQRDGYDVLTLNQPDRLNPFNERQHQALAAALDRIEKNDDCRVVILTGAGRGFCAGQDLSERDFTDASQKYDLGAGLEKYYNPLVRRLRALDKPVICAVNGVAAGAGANIALSADIVIAARSASFIQIFARIGLIPDAGGTWWLTQRLGEARAKALALTTEPTGAGARWSICTRMETVVSSPVSSSATAAMAASSHRAMIRGVARTGTSPLWAARAVSSADTVRSTEALRPSCTATSVR